MTCLCPPFRRIIGKGEPVFQAIWTENTDYGEVLISPGMIQDHMPDNVLRALNRVSYMNSLRHEDYSNSIACNCLHFTVFIQIRLVSSSNKQKF